MSRSALVVLKDGAVVGRSPQVNFVGAGVTAALDAGTVTVTIPGGTGGGTPAVSVVAETAFAQSAAVGVHANYARQDHTHGTPTNPVTTHEVAGNPHPQYALASQGFTVVKRTADLARVSTAVVAADPVLSISLAAATRYLIRGSVFYDTNVTADFKWRHAYTGTTTTYRLRRSAIVPAATAYTLIAIDAAVSAADIAMVAAAGTIGFFEWECVVLTNAAGVWSINWAQNTSNVGAATVLAGSYIEYATV